MPSETAREDPVALRIHLLGGFRISLDIQVVPEGGWRLQRAKTLVKLLALALGHQLHREQALDLLWPDVDLKDPNNSLHQVLHAARSAIEYVKASASSFACNNGNRTS